LFIGDGEHSVEYPNLGLKLHAVRLMDTRPEGRIYKLLVDLEEERVLSEEEAAALRAAEAEARQAKYGRLEPALYERLQLLADEDTLQVAVWVKAPPGKSLSELEQQAFALMAEKYPEAKVALARSGKPMDVADQELARRIETDLHAYIDTEMRAYAQPLVTELEQQGFAETSTIP
jgi:hypothetical protein